MHVSYDPAKNDRDILERGLSFESAVDFEFETALVALDERRDYVRTRYVALGLMAGRVHVLCFAETSDGIRVISFRKANAREVSRHEQAQATD